MLYGCDFHWWRINGGVPGFKGLKLSNSNDVAARYADIHKVTVEKTVHDMLTEKPGVIGSGTNGGHQMVNLAVQFGTTFIALVAFDMCFGPGGATHWHGNHGNDLGNPRAETLESWRAHLDGQAKWFRRHGIEVINCSASSALRNYPKMTLHQALERFESSRCQMQSA